VVRRLYQAALDGGSWTSVPADAPEQTGIDVGPLGGAARGAGTSIHPHPVIEPRSKAAAMMPGCQRPDSTMSVRAAAGRINGDREREIDVADIRRLPGPAAELWEWQVHGACRGMDSARFFYPEGERSPRRERREAAAKAICARCPVITDCRTHALQVQEPYGIWGGLTENERLAILTYAAV
jgi:WhiB family redox-sensing transcriptional regulator